MTEEIIERLKGAVLSGDIEGAEEWAKRSLELKLDPAQVIQDGLIGGIKKVGEDFGRGILYLPELVASAEACKAGSTILEEEIKQRGGQWKPVGTLVIGTVWGDIHDIGKTLVSTFFKASGFNVIDLGVNVPKENFIDAVRTHKPEILALSSLLTTTIMEQKYVMDALKESGLRSGVKTLVGGGVVTAKWATEIGADGYGENAQEAVAMAKTLLGVE
jgi:corrinoid protein of di/trimethylamine methyltransferase